MKAEIKLDVQKTTATDGTCIYYEIDCDIDAGGKEYLKSCLKNNEPFICLNGSWINKAHIVKVDFID